MRKATRTQWIKFSIVTLLYLAFLVWVKSWLGLIVLPFIFDIYISKKIPWGFWKKSENPAVRSIMSWVDAIVFALVAVYFVNIYVFQNYQIPSSSLEKSLLVGDFLYVSKMSYGPRVPNTPLSMPLAQHTLPVFNTKSYIEWPQWEYKRVPGFGKVKLNDIVVFNFPAGDTVATNFQQTDFYTLAYEEGKRVYPNKVNMDSLTRKQQRTVYDLYYKACPAIRCKSRKDRYTSTARPSRTLQKCSSTTLYRLQVLISPMICSVNWASAKRTRH